jgi:hypothetical protein
MRHSLLRLGAAVALGVALTLPLAACGRGGADTAAQSPAGLDQIPLTIRAGSATHHFTVEVARTEAQQEQGLMGRTELAADRGMLFPFSAPKFAAFWMKNTLIPLDMLFIRADGTIDRIAENTVPQNLEPLASGGMVSAVLELPGGTAARLGIDESAKVTWGDRH